MPNLPPPLDTFSADRLREDAAADYLPTPYVNRLRTHDAMSYHSRHAGETILVPLLAHDFDASASWYERGLAAGEVKELAIDGKQVRAVAYADDENLITLAHILNAMINTRDGEVQIERSFRLVGQSLTALERADFALPSVHSLDAVAISRKRSRAEFLAPFQCDARQSAGDVFAHLGQDILDKAQTGREVALLEACLQRVLGGLK